MAIDVGEKRIGLAFASGVAKLPRPLATVIHNEEAFESILATTQQENIGTIVVGLPLNSDSKPTNQTVYTEAFISKLRQKTGIPIVTCDEALSSKRAKQELVARRKHYQKSDVDALAATYILEDYLQETGKV